MAAPSIAIYVKKRGGLLERRQLAAEQASQTGTGAAHADIEFSKERIDRADFVKAHLVDQALEDQRIVGEQVDAPLPVVEADRAGDDLLHRPGITAAHQPMLFHLALALLDGQCVPVLLFSAAAVHGIKA